MLGTTNIEKDVFKISHKVFRMRMKKHKYRPLYYIGQQLSNAISIVLDLLPCMEDKPDLHNYLVWLLIKMCCAIRNLRATMRQVALQDMRLSTDQILSTLPGDGENVVGMQFREDLMKGRYTKANKHRMWNEAGRVCNMVTKYSHDRGDLSLYPNALPVAVPQIKRAVEWVCDGVPSSFFLEARERMQTIGTSRFQFRVKRQSNTKYTKHGNRCHHNIFQLAIHLAKCLEAGCKTERIEFEQNIKNL